jgi:hypothetical protein
MCVDENGVQNEYSVPPPLVRKDLIAQMHADAREIMPHAFLDCVMKIRQPFFTPIYDFTAPAIVFGRVALVGDAAANARPHMGFGMAKAGTDAQALAKHLRDPRASRPRVCGIASPSALAVLRFITSSNLVGFNTGKIGRFFALENPADIDPYLTIGVGRAGSVTHQPTG